MGLEKTIAINNLIDMYGRFLTEKQLLIINDYFKNDYSLSEIADNLNISKQAVKNAIDMSLEKLKMFEKNLHVIEVRDEVLEYIANNKNQDYTKLLEILNKLGD